MKYILTSILLLIAVLLIAAPISQEQALRAVRNWTSVWAPEEFAGKSIEKVIPIRDKAETQMYLFEYENGFVITSADDAVLPVLGYGFNTRLGNPEANPSFWNHIQTLQEEIIQIKAQGLSNTETAEKWQRVLSNQIERNNERNVAPLLSTKWNQDWPYNMYCPVDAAGPGGRVYAGCVATAMGQVMKYWNWPVTGVGSHSYYASGYGTQTANFGATTYQWAQMPNSVHTPNDAVGRLLYHCGVAVNMMYSPTGSGAYSASVGPAWINYFRYNPGTQQKQKNNFSNSAWEQLLRDELDAARPMYYSGSGPSGGHAFNCDGYQGTNYFHFNWGWGGSYDGYFLVTNLNPGSTFNNNQAAIFNVYPVNYSISAVQMSLQGMNGSVGDTIPISIVSYPLMPEWNISNISFVLEFDSVNMSFQGFNTSGTMLDGASITTTELQPGRMQFNVSVPSGLSGGGTLLKANFQPWIPGNFAFNLSDFYINTTMVSLLNATSIDITAQILEVQNSVLDILNAMYVPYDAVATIGLTTTFLLPTWNVQNASFVLHYPANLISWEGFETEGCLTQNSAVEVINYGSGDILLNLDFNGVMVGSGNLLKLKFRATGNTGSVALATVTMTDFFYNQTPVANLLPGHIVLLPVTANEDNTVVPAVGINIGPNPFYETTKLTLELPKTNQRVNISIYNLKGQLVHKLYDTEVKGTALNLEWNGKDTSNREVPNGMYLLKLSSEGLYKTIKLIKHK